MAAAVCCPVVKDSLPSGATNDPGVVALAGDGDGARAVHPIHFLYGHLHNSIRTELDNLSNWVLALEADNEQDLQQRLRHLKERYHFLEQVYKYHSSVEDEVRCFLCCFNSSFKIHVPWRCSPLEFACACHCCCAAVGCSWQVVYPALDSKVKNVTSAYSVEHQDEVGGISAAGPQQLVCSKSQPLGQPVSPRPHSMNNS